MHISAEVVEGFRHLPSKVFKNPHTCDHKEYLKSIGLISYNLLLRNLTAKNDELAKKIAIIFLELSSHLNNLVCSRHLTKVAVKVF